SVTIHCNYQKDLPLAAIDDTQLQEIFLNLIKNAIDALEGKGGKRKGGGNVWLETFRDDGKVVISVKDDGPGIDDAIRDRLFDPFVSTKSTEQGTGLGLSICYAIVKRYDGEIRVVSEPGNGAQFTVVLPAHLPKRTDLNHRNNRE
ncbi:MAG: ATP-binding protein, partial [Thermodesulfobacteriota bacterium]|nr:ATP-binding protein [Thermodesulfobacteriota bacterium]